MRQEMKKLLFTESEAAKYLKTSVSKLQKSRTSGSSMILNGLAPAFVKHLGGPRYCPKELRQFKSKTGPYGFYGQVEKICAPKRSEAKSITTQSETKPEESSFDWSAIVKRSGTESITF